MKLTLTYIKTYEKVSKAGKPFTSVSIKAKEYGDKFLSGFGNAQNKNWKVGDEVEVEKVEEKNGYLNFEMPKAQRPNVEAMAAMTAQNKELAAINYKLNQIINHLSGKDRLDLTSAGTPVPTFDQPSDIEDTGVDQIRPEDIPF